MLKGLTTVIDLPFLCHESENFVCCNLVSPYKLIGFGVNSSLIGISLSFTKPYSAEVPTITTFVFSSKPKVSIDSNKLEQNRVLTEKYSSLSEASEVPAKWKR